MVIPQPNLSLLYSTLTHSHPHPDPIPFMPIPHLLLGTPVGTPLGTPRGRSGSVILGIGTIPVVESNASNPGLDSELTLLEKLHQSLSEEQTAQLAEAKAQLQAQTDELPTKQSSMKPESSSTSTVKAARNITFESFTTHQDHPSSEAIHDTDTDASMIIADLPKLATTMLYVVDLKLVGEEDTLTITLPGDNMSRTSSMRLLRNSSAGG